MKPYVESYFGLADHAADHNLGCFAFGGRWDITGFTRSIGGGPDGMDIKDICAVIVTRGGYDISEVTDSLKGFGHVAVWHNDSPRVKDMFNFEPRVYGRYIAGAYCGWPVVYFQDDDAVVDVQAVCAAYEPGVIVCNSDPHHRAVNASLYSDGTALVGWGAVCDASLIQPTFIRWDKAGMPHDELLYRECDRVFTALNNVKLIEAPFRHLERASDGSRMWQESRHLSDLAEIKERIAKVRAA